MNKEYVYNYEMSQTTGTQTRQLYLKIGTFWYMSCDLSEVEYLINVDRSQSMSFQGFLLLHMYLLFI